MNTARVLGGLIGAVSGFVLVVVALAGSASTTTTVLATFGILMFSGGVGLVGWAIAVPARDAIWATRQTARTVEETAAAVARLRAGLNELNEAVDALQTDQRAGVDRVAAAIATALGAVDGVGSSVDSLREAHDRRFDRVDRTGELIQEDLQATRRDVANARAEVEKSANRLDRSLQLRYRQMEALLGLETSLGFAAPLPPFGGWALTAQAGLFLANQVITRPPQTVVEFGSGISTIVIARALQANGSGRLLSFEHDEQFAETTAAFIAAHGLSDWVELRVGALEPVDLDGEDWLWYPMHEFTDSIDLVLVDGPPGGTQPLARYPAMPLLRADLSPGAVLILDDVDREDEQEILRRWEATYPGDRISIQHFERHVAVVDVVM